MKHIIAAYNGTGLTLATKQDEVMLRDEIMKELTSLVHQRKHFLKVKNQNQMWFHQAFAQLDSFCSNNATLPLGSVCGNLIRTEPVFTLILPNPTGKHSFRFDNFQIILAIAKAYLNATRRNIPGRRQ